MTNNNYKVALVTEDGNTISRHFGSAPLYEVFTIESGKIVSRERKEKFNPHAPGMQHEHHNHGEMGHHSDEKHNSMLQNISDCQFLISRGMGYGIYQHLENAKIKPIITDIALIEEAVKAVIDETIINHSEKLH
jgi:predicted Fe-Mo cluster-binding NifX family protein